MTAIQLAHRHHRALCAAAAFTLFTVLIAAAKSLAIEIHPLGLSEHTARSIAHLTVYATITLLIGYALRGRWVTAIIIAASLGAIEEFYQMFIPDRYATLGDWLLDLTGAAAAATLAAAITITLKLLRRANQDHPHPTPAPPSDPSDLSTR